MLVTSRSYDEYVAMFALRSDDMSGTLLDSCAGAADFAAVAASRGGRVIAADPAYALPRQALAGRVKEDTERGAGIAAEFPDRFSWEWYGDPTRRDRLRRAALARFLADIVTAPGRYVAAQLPQLPFADRAFDLAVSSHLLFTWADQLGLDWHLAALAELTRVAREVRVYPTVLQGAGGPPAFWDDLLSRLAATGRHIELRPVDYVFQVGATQMLVVASAAG